MKPTIQDSEPATRAQIGYIVGLTHDYSYLDKELTKSEAGRKIRDCLKVKKYLEGRRANDLCKENNKGESYVQRESQ